MTNEQLLNKIIFLMHPANNKDCDEETCIKLIDRIKHFGAENNISPHVRPVTFNEMTIEEQICMLFWCSTSEYIDEHGTHDRDCCLDLIMPNLLPDDSYKIFDWDKVIHNADFKIMKEPLYVSEKERQAKIAKEYLERILEKHEKLNNNGTD